VIRPPVRIERRVGSLDQIDDGIARCRLDVLVNRQHDRLDVVIAPTSCAPIFRTSARAFKNGGLSVALGSYHFTITAPQHSPFGRARFFFLQPVALRAERVNVVQHPIQQRLG
jgi:hypothetical protein